MSLGLCTLCRTFDLLCWIWLILSKNETFENVITCSCAQISCLDLYITKMCTNQKSFLPSKHTKLPTSRNWFKVEGNMSYWPGNKSHNNPKYWYNPNMAFQRVFHTDFRIVGNGNAQLNFFNREKANLVLNSLFLKCFYMTPRHNWLHWYLMNLQNYPWDVQPKYKCSLDLSTIKCT